jgi:hypothetical protein
MYCTVNLTGAATGVYDIKIEKPGQEPVLLEQAFTVHPGIGPRLEVKLIMPSIIRSFRRNAGWVEYKNTGDADAASPVIRLKNDGQTKMQTGTSGRKSDKDLYLLGVPDQGPAGVLPPMSSYRTPFNFMGAGGDSVEVEAYIYQPDDTKIDWDVIEPDFRPPLVDVKKWLEFWRTATSPMGVTGKEVLDNVYAILAGSDGNIDYKSDFPGLLKAALALSGITGEASKNIVSKWTSAPPMTFNPTTDINITWLNGFNPAYDCTYIVTHGRDSNPDVMKPLAAAINKHCNGNCNIALIDWRVGAGGWFYNAAKNARYAGTAAYEKLKKQVGGYDFDKMVYVGHSFGNVVNKWIAHFEKDGGKAKGRGLILDPAMGMGGLGKYAQPDFADYYKGGSTSYSTAHPADAGPCLDGRIADRQLYMSNLSHGGARECLKDVLNRPQSGGGCDNDWLKGQVQVPPGGPGRFDGRMNCDGSYSRDVLAPCDEFDKLKNFLPLRKVSRSVSYVFRSADPNEKVGMLGAGAPDYFIRPGTEVSYTVFFENKPEATAPAQEVFITDNLDNDLDWSSLRLGEIAFGDITVAALAGKSSGSTNVMKDGYRVDIEVLFDRDAGRIHWIFRTIDPETGEWPSDPLAGFLPPNDPATGSGEGHVSFFIRTKSQLADGAEITNKAGIVFDTEAKIETNTWKNIINSQIVVNVPPVANAGEDISIFSIKTPVTVIRGSASDEDPGDTLEYAWREGNTVLKPFAPVGGQGECPLDLSTVSMGPGSHQLTLEVTDSTESASDVMELTIKNSPPLALPGGGGQYEINTAVTLNGKVSDYDGDLLTYKWLLGTRELHAGTVQPPVEGVSVSIPDFSISTLELGGHTLTLRVQDGVNPPISGEVKVDIVDTTPPELSPVVDKTVLWPPNHKMTDIVITANASDNSGLPVQLSASVSSSEPAADGSKGDKSPDWTGPVINRENGAITLKLRAERSGKEKQGRVYTITITAADTSNNKSTAKVTVTVPHDRKQE